LASDSGHSLIARQSAILRLKEHFVVMSLRFWVAKDLLHIITAFDHRDENGELIQLEMESLACDCIVKAYVPFPEHQAECPKHCIQGPPSLSLERGV
jgi:hypothetical protein